VDREIDVDVGGGAEVAGVGGSDEMVGGERLTKVEGLDHPDDGHWLRQSLEERREVVRARGSPADGVEVDRGAEGEGGASATGGREAWRRSRVGRSVDRETDVDEGSGAGGTDVVGEDEVVGTEGERLTKFESSSITLATATGGREA